MKSRSFDENANQNDTPGLAEDFIDDSECLKQLRKRCRSRKPKKVLSTTRECYSSNGSSYAARSATGTILESPSSEIRAEEGKNAGAVVNRGRKWSTRRYKHPIIHFYISFAHSYTCEHSNVFHSSVHEGYDIQNWMGPGYWDWHVHVLQHWLWVSHQKAVSDFYK